MFINNNYKIECQDYLNVVLSEKKIVKEGEKKGEELWVPVAYCPNVKYALRALVDREIHGTGLRDFQEVVKKYEELIQAIEKVAKE